MSPLSSLTRRFLTLAALSAATVLFAQEREYSFADSTVEDLQKYKVASEAKNKLFLIPVRDSSLSMIAA